MSNRKRPVRPSYNTSSATHSNHLKQNEHDRVYFADVEARLRSLQFEPTPLEIKLADRCVALMRKPRQKRKTSVYKMVIAEVDGENRQMLVTRYVISRLYEAGIKIARDQ